VLLVDLVTKSWTQLHSAIFEASEAIVGLEKGKDVLAYSK